MRYFYFCLLLLFGYAGNAQINTNNLLQGLSNEIGKSSSYDHAKEQNIQQIKAALHATNSLNADAQFLLIDSLYDEYAIYNYDSAFVYAVRLQQLAIKFNNEDYLAKSRINFGHTLLSAGLYKEAADTLNIIKIQSRPPAMKATYYALMARFYYDLASYDYDPNFSANYDLRGNGLIDSALVYFPPSSFEFNYYSGLKYFKKGDKGQTLYYFNKIIDRKDLSDHQLALVASTLSGIYIQEDNLPKAKELLIKAAIADIRSSTKETSATLDLAKILFENGGDIKNAFICVEKANKDAIFYGARQRKIQVGTLMPLIEAQKINNVELQKKSLLFYAIIVTVLFLLLIILAVTVYHQVNKLKAAKKLVTEAHSHLQLVNVKLSESNAIKEKYIAFFFEFYSKFYEKIEKFKAQIEEKANNRKVDEIKFIINNIHLKREKEELLLNFDKIFLSLFPNFVENFNGLLRKEEAIKLKEGELLNTDLRIFALIRMGLHDTDKIAKILEYSVNTIYAYKAKMKNKSFLPKDDFEMEVMKL